MECPVRFNVWGKIVSAHRELALLSIREQAVFGSEIELRKAISRAVQDDSLMQVSSALGYAEALKLIERTSLQFKDATLCQESWPPSDGSSYCAEHNFHFGGCLGCHVCQDFYVK